MCTLQGASKKKGAGIAPAPFGVLFVKIRRLDYFSGPA